MRTYISILINSKKKNKFIKKKKQKPSNEITEDDINFFLTTIKEVQGGYPKVRDLQKLLRPSLDLVKINAILRYLMRSKSLEIDLDGNIIWIRVERSNQSTLADVANISEDFQRYFPTKG
jgi:hypothetical protein